MHAFGEVRYCAREVLEMVEDTVRDVVIRVAAKACHYATTDGAQVVGIPHVERCLGMDTCAVQRLRKSLKRSSELHPGLTLDPGPVKKGGRRAWEAARDMADLGQATAGAGGYALTDMMSLCSWRAVTAFRAAMNTVQFQDFAMCRGVTLVHQESKSRAPSVRGQPRVVLFREWLAIDQWGKRTAMKIPDETLFALGHVAWEAIGVITQTSLLHRYFDDLRKGFGDPRAVSWNYGRHLVAALNYGLGTAIMVPLTELQANALRQEIDTYLTVMQVASHRWRGYSQASSPCLLPQHVREALRRIAEAPNGSVGLRERSFVISAGFL